MWLFPLQRKSDVFATFKQFHVMAERQFQTKLKSVQTDWGGEFRNLSSFFSTIGILHRLSCPHTGEQNGFVERRHRYVVETGLTLMAQSGVPTKFWHYAFDTAVYLINRMPSRTSNNKCLDLVTNKQYVTRRVRFNEQSFPFLQTTSDLPSSTSPSYPYFSSYPSQTSPTSVDSLPTTSPITSQDTTTSSQTSARPPTSPPTHSLARDSASNLTKMAGIGNASTSRSGSRIVGDRYDFVPRSVVKSTTVRVVLSLAVTHQWPLRQLDVQIAFLRGDLKETVYLRQPQGFVDPQKPNHLCLLHKSLYGLKQAPRAWFDRLSGVLLQLGFMGSKTDPSLFIYSSKGNLMYMLVYVDDIIVTGNYPCLINHIIHKLSLIFAIQDMGSLSYFLGVEVVPRGRDLILSQRKYILDIIHKAGLTTCKSVDSPMTTTAKLALDDSPFFGDPVKYRQIVGSLQYLTLSRPDTTFAVNKVYQFMHSPTENHWSAVKRILCYLQGICNFGLLLQHHSSSVLHAYTDASSPSLYAFSDADWAGCPDDRQSTGGFAVYLGSNLISWCACKQRIVSRSSTKSEYKALADTVVELTWLEALLQELNVSMSSAPVYEKVAQIKLSVQFIKTDDQIADVFTKPLSSQRFLLLRSKLQEKNNCPESSRQIWRTGLTKQQQNTEENSNWTAVDHKSRCQTSG
ncbi:hypothetical protein E3N88_29602 [Mikania micrantha]|uniref:Integrase catalytic domain-containing protein n=1 Tax=Mikania micrantha TaxID=192012 RepID=A0A5N6MK69_9ASTR|nr:hypothetical protein E3N88_29602 [Mikania micrantha]